MKIASAKIQRRLFMRLCVFHSHSHWAAIRNSVVESTVRKKKPEKNSTEKKKKQQIQRQMGNVKWYIYKNSMRKILITI